MRNAILEQFLKNRKNQNLVTRTITR